MNEPNNNNGEAKTAIAAPVIKYGIAAIFAIIGVSGSFKLIVYESSSSSLVALISICLMGLLLIFFGDQIDWFDLKNLKVKMKKIEKARSEVESKEKTVREISILLGDLITFLNATAISGSSPPAQEEWLKLKLSKLEQLSGKKINNAFLRHSERLNSCNPNDNEQLKEILNKFRQDVEAEVVQLKK